MEVRLTLWNELIAKHEVTAYFIRNKLAALMVSIARYDWPHVYSDFFENIVEVCINLLLKIIGSNILICSIYKIVVNDHYISA